MNDADPQKSPVKPLRALSELKPLPAALAKWRGTPAIRELTRAISTTTATNVTKNLENPE